MRQLCRSTGSPEGFSLVEVLIVVLMLAILAMIVVPQFAISQDEARDAALSTDLKAIRRQIELYRLQHGGRGPEENENGQFDTANFVNRLIGRTTPQGAIDPNGECGPYLPIWPSNPFCEAAVAEQVKFGKTNGPPRDGTSGWYFDILLRQIYPNSTEGAESLD